MIVSAVICGRNDKVMQELADEHDVEIVVIKESDKI